MKTLALLLGCALAVLAENPALPKRAAVASTAPSLVRKVEAQYTAEARAKHVEGLTQLAVIINADGVPSGIRVVKTLDAGLDAMAVQALALWRFQPATKDGKPISTTATIDFHFRLSKFPLLHDPADVPEPEPYVDNDPVWQ